MCGSRNKILVNGVSIGNGKQIGMPTGGGVVVNSGDLKCRHRISQLPRLSYGALGLRTWIMHRLFFVSKHLASDTTTTS